MTEAAGQAELVRTIEDADVITIVLDNAANSNRINSVAMHQLIRGLQLARASDCATLVVRASGPDFTVGRDQKERAAGVTREESLRLILEVNSLLRAFPGVSVCMVQGRAYGFGSGLALQCDITVAADDAEFGFDEVIHGLPPLVVAGYLSDYVAPKISGELLLTGRTVPALEALSLRMVNKVVRVSDLPVEAERMAGHLSSLDRGALRLIKQFISRMRAGLVREPESEGVRELARWLEAGRPAFPSVEP